MTAKAHKVELTHGAESDLAALYDYMAENRSPDQADALLMGLLDKVALLETFPERGSVPGEQAALGIRDFRQTVLPPYRIFYRVVDTRVVILLIADGRRDMRSLLEERVLRG